MRKLIKHAMLVVLSVGLVQGVNATTITGGLAFTGQVTYNNSSPGNASQVTTWTGVTVTSGSGVFAGSNPFAIAPGSAVTFASGAWNFHTTSPINSFWSVGGFTFQLLSSIIVSQGGTPGVNGFVVVDGTGIISGHGYTPTTMSWSFSSYDLGLGGNPQRWSFNTTANGSSPATVPDGGSTLLLLGLTLSGLVSLKRKFNF